jgi:hypothetical protein
MQKQMGRKPVRILTNEPHGEFCISLLITGSPCSLDCTTIYNREAIFNRYFYRVASGYLKHDSDEKSGYSLLMQKRASDVLIDFMRANFFTPREWKMLESVVREAIENDYSLEETLEMARKRYESLISAPALSDSTPQDTRN